MKPEEKENKRSLNMQFQFCLAVYLRSEYESDKDKASNLYSEWGGVEFSNSWQAGIDHGKEICKKNPEYICVLIDRMSRKQPLEIKADGKELENV
jgi:hypothetical protein